jgi:DNA-binding GntR family transcriptional regulator
MLNCKGAILLDLKDEDEEKSSVTVKLDNVVHIEIDDNSEEIEEGLMSEYHCENIYIEMQDFSKIRIELQW